MDSPEPLSTTRAATSSSHILAGYIGNLYLQHILCQLCLQNILCYLYRSHIYYVSFKETVSRDFRLQVKRHLKVPIEVPYMYNDIHRVILFEEKYNRTGSRNSPVKASPGSQFSNQKEVQSSESNNPSKKCIQKCQRLMVLQISQLDIL